MSLQEKSFCLAILSISKFFALNKMKPDGHIKINFPLWNKTSKSSRIQTLSII